MKRRLIYHILAAALCLGILLPAVPPARALTSTGSAAGDIVAAAREELGYGAGMTGAGKYGEFFGDASAERSCAFVCWCAAQAGVSQNVFPREMGCISLKKAFEDKDRYERSAAQGGTYRPKAGDVVFFSSTKSAFNLTHVGLATAVSETTVSVVEWDYADKVSATVYALSNAMIVAYGVPAYDENAAVYRAGRYITNESMRLRAAPALEAEVRLVIPVNSTVTVTEVRGIWGKTEWEGTEGWMSLEYSTYIVPGQNAEVNWLVADFSQWTTTAQIRWSQLKSDGVEAVILRVGGRGYGSAKTMYVDDRFQEHYKNAKAAGLHVGFYFFSYALNESMAKEEAQMTVTQLQKYGCEPDMPVFIDIEDADGDRNMQHYRAGKAVCTKVVNAFCDTIRAEGYYPGVYCSKWFAESMLDSSVFTDRAVWIAQYGVARCDYAGKMDLWQYTQSGRIGSVTVKVDLSRCYTNFPALINPPPEIEEPRYGHTLPENWTESVKATCSAPGQRVKACTDCGKVLLTEAIPKGAHSPGVDHVFINDFTVRAGSTLTGDLLKRLHPATEKNYDILYLATYELKGGTKLTFCKSCNIVLTAEYSHPGCAHTAQKTSDSPSTCAEQGVRETVCEACGEILKTELLPLAAHKPGETRTVSANCTEGGMRMLTCAVCGEEISGEYTEVVPHAFGDPVTEVAPTILSDGKAVYTCAVCGVKEEGPLPAVTLGDADLDGSVEVADARLALRKAVGLQEIEDPVGAQAADTDNDGEITVDDARVILRIAVGLEDPAALLQRFYSDASEKPEQERAE